MIKHGMYGTRPYRIWCGIKRRCYNKKDACYPRYGAKGIVMSASWKASFKQFWSDMGTTYKDGLSIDRINNKKGYSKENCRWADKLTQGRNRRGVILYPYKDEMLPLTAIAERMGMSQSALHYRKRHGKNGADLFKEKYNNKDKGIYWDKNRSLWLVALKRNKKIVNLGRFENKETARKIRDEYVAVSSLLNSII